MSPVSVRLFEYLYRLLLLLYPTAQRDRFGDDMVECFRDLAVHTHARRGVIGVAVLFARTIMELPHSVWQAWRSGKGGGGTMDTFRRDVRIGVRGLLLRPGMTLLAVLSIALGVGANTTMFSWAYVMLWEPLDVPEPDRMVRVVPVTQAGPAINVSYPDFVDLAELDVFDGALVHGMRTFAVGSGGESRVANGEIVSPGYFEVLRLRPEVGRFFSEASVSVAPEVPEVVLAYTYWRTHLAEDRSVVGRPMQLNGHLVDVVGIAGESFNGTKFGIGIDLWVSIPQWGAINGSSMTTNRATRSISMVARLADGASIQEAGEAVDVVMARLADEYPASNTGRGYAVMAERVGNFGAGSTLPNLIGVLAVAASSLVLLIACGNVGAMLLARGVSRRRELGIRLALGAGRRQVMMQLLTESLLLALMGGAAGVGLAYVLAPQFYRLAPVLPYRLVFDPSPGGAVLTFALAVTVLASLVFGIAPALHGSRTDLNTVLKSSSQGGGSRTGLMNGLVVGVVGMAFFSLTVATLFLQSLANAQTAELGMTRTDRVLAIVEPGLAGYRADSTVVGFYDQLRIAAKAIPGVSEAAISTSLPLADWWSTSGVYDDAREYGDDDFGVDAWWVAVGEGYFNVADTPLLSGRPFGPQDRVAGSTTVVVNEALATRLWPGKDPLGQRIRFGRQAGGFAREVVGVVPTGHYESVSARNRAAFFLPLGSSIRTRAVLWLDFEGDPGVLSGQLRSVVASVDENVPVVDIRTIEAHVESAQWAFTMAASMTGGLGVLALFLALSGLYGVMAHSVGTRKREMGVRMALGADEPDLVRLVMRSGLRLTMLGVGVGLVLALAVGGALESVLYGVSAQNPLTLLGVTAVLGVVSLSAALIPALAAARSDPVAPLRSDG